MGCSARNLLQQLGRFRILSEQNVLALLSSQKDNRTNSPELAHLVVMRELKERRALFQGKYKDLLSYDVENKDGDLVLSPD